VPDRPRTATDYTPELTISARETLLYIATTLGDLLDQIVLVGGLVPSLIVNELGGRILPFNLFELTQDTTHQ